MRTSLLLSFFVGTCSIIAAVADDLFYVGFDLKPTYGTSAAVYTNGTMAGVAYVEGDECYKETMRKLSQADSTHRAPPYQYPGIDDIADKPRLAWRNFRKSLGLPPSSDVGALSAMVKALQEETEKKIGHPITKAAASVPRFPAIYDEDLYDAFEHAGLEYLQIKWREGGPAWGFLTYDTLAALAGHNFSLCADYTNGTSCHANDHLEDQDLYLLVTYTQSDLMISNIIAYGHDLYYTYDTVGLYLGLGNSSSGRQGVDGGYFEKLMDKLVAPLRRGLLPTKIIYVGDCAHNEVFRSFAEWRYRSYFEELNQTMPEIIDSDPVYTQAKGVAELARRRPYLPLPVKPRFQGAKEKAQQGFEL